MGLGNPGSEYEGTRHNAGFGVVELLASRHSGRLRLQRGLHAAVAEVRLESRRVALATPVTFMNDSGRAASPLLRRFGITSLASLVVVHDELDLPVGTVRVKLGGGSAGHNGLRSIASHLHSSDFCRVRVGIGRPPGRAGAVGYVLSRPRGEDKEALATGIEVAADAVEMLADCGVEAAMNRFNAR